MDVALNDEGQQYGNLDKSSAIAQVPAKVLSFGVVITSKHQGTAQDKKAGLDAS